MILYNSCICSTLACCNGTMYIEPCTLHNVQYTMFNVQCTNLGKKMIKMGWKNGRNCIFSPQLVKSMHIFFPIWLKIYTKIEKKVNSVQCTMYNVQCTKLLTFFLHIFLYIVQNCWPFFYLLPIHIYLLLDFVSIVSGIAGLFSAFGILYTVPSKTKPDIFFKFFKRSY